MKKVGIIGGGLAGLVTAYRLQKNGFEVVIFEKNSFLGGQLYAVPVYSQMTDIYYHHTFLSDKNFIDLCDEIGIAEKIKWYNSSMAYYTNGKLYPFGKPFDLFKFSPLNFFGKIKFVISVFHLQYRASRNKLDDISAQDWFKNNGYSDIWKIVWEPLFRLKFGDLTKNITILWLADKLIKRGKSRGKTASEKLCYVDGSFYTVIQALEKKLNTNNCNIEINSNVINIIEENGKYAIVTDDTRFSSFDFIISTLSTGNHSRLAKFDVAYHEYLNKYTYQSAICVMLVLSKKFSDYYWINIGDFSISFGGIIEHTNLVGVEMYEGNTIIYMSKYLDCKNDYFQYSDEKIISLFVAGLKKIKNDFLDEYILQSHVFRERDAQPIINIGYCRPNITTPLKNYFWISTHHVYPHDRGVEYAIDQANKISDYIVNLNVEC